MRPAATQTVMNQPRHVAVVAALVRDTEGRILLARHHKRGWEMPQGRVEEGESLLQEIPLPASGALSTLKSEA